MVPRPDSTARLRRPTHVPWRLIWLALLLVVLHLSLYPFTGWQLRQSSAFSFLLASRQRWVLSDFVANVGAYVILGFIWLRAWHAHGRRPLMAVAAVTACCTLISCSVETLQSFLPSRVPTYFDVLANGGGALLGSLAAAVWLQHLRSVGQVPHAGWRADLVTPHGVGRAAGWTLVLLWLLAQIPPHRVVLGAGELPAPLVQALHDVLRILLVDDAAPPRPTTWRSVADMLVVASAMVMLELILREIVQSRWLRWALLAALVLCGVALRVAAAWPLRLDEPLALWLTPAVMAGAALGLLLILLLEPLPHALRLGALVLLALMHFVALNTTPIDAYFLNAAQRMYGLVTRYVTPSLRQLLLLAGVMWPPLVALYGLTMAVGLQRTRRGGGDSDGGVADDGSENMVATTVVATPSRSPADA